MKGIPILSISTDKKGELLTFTIEFSTLFAAYDLKVREAIVHTIVVGNGAAGNSAASAIRDLNGHVTIVSEEPFPEYNACALKYYLSNAVSRQQLFLKTMADYSKMGINTILGSSVEKIDGRAQKIILTNKVLEYDKLIIATGARVIIPKIPGTDKEGLFALKTMGDADAILAFPIRKLVIIGSGFIGVEAGISLRKRGIDVTLVELMNRLLPRAFDRKPSQIIENFITEHGIHVLKEENVLEILGDRVVQAVRTANREIECDAVLVSAGMRPNVELARSAGVTIGDLGGIVTDEHMLTNVANIYACGDCTESKDILSDKNVLQLTWPNAVIQGKVAGYSSCGLLQEYGGQINFIGIDVFGVHAVSIGQAPEAYLAGEGFQIIEKTYPERYHRIIAKDGVIAGAQFIGATRDLGVLSQAIRKKFNLEKLRATANKGQCPIMSPIFRKIIQYI